MVVRLNTSFLAVRERALLAAIVRRLSPSTTPNHLTAIGLFGAVLAAAGFVACNWSSSFLPLVVLGLFLNWFGDSLDGTLARYRRTERPRYGFFIDHSSDLISQSLIVMGLGFSPYLSVSSALFVLSLYLLMSSYTYLKVVTGGVHRLSYGGLGATEFRILVALWSIFAEWAGPGMGEAPIIDVVIASLAACTFLFFVFMVRSDLAQIEGEDEKTTTIYKLAPRRRDLAESDVADLGFTQTMSEGDIQLKRARYNT